VTAPASGLVLADKPVGPSSFAIVRALRRRYGSRAGHAGTLDPLASGLLLVLLGGATRLARYLVGLDKRYVTEIELGARTSTGDAEGEVVERPAIPGDVPAAVAALEGEVELPVPAASALKIGGERAYRLRRRGVEVEMPSRRSIVHEARVVGLEPPLVTLELHVSSGTYVRSIADALGGHCASLRRTAVGPFRVEDADEDVVIAPRDALAFLAESPLSDDELGFVLAGRAVERDGEGRVRLVHDGRLVAVARLGGGLARPETVLAA
jgi:tRNA pseudouridine55 synthase